MKPLIWKHYHNASFSKSINYKSFLSGENEKGIDCDTTGLSRVRQKKGKLKEDVVKKSTNGNGNKLKPVILMLKCV
jgi:hypothetical protein